MLLFVGLGNKGLEFKNTRHNVGFLITDYLAKKYSFVKINNKLKSVLFKGSILNTNIILSQPTTMMNLSGLSVKLVKNFYKINKNNIFVFHDELDLDLARIKFKLGGGSAGHNGIKNIDKNIGSEYYRIRVGIKNADSIYKDKNFVLSNFSDKEKLKLYNKIKLIDQSIKYILKKDINNFMNFINRE